MDGEYRERTESSGYVETEERKEMSQSLRNYIAVQAFSDLFFPFRCCRALLAVLTLATLLRARAWAIKGGQWAGGSEHRFGQRICACAMERICGCERDAMSETMRKSSLAVSSLFLLHRLLSLGLSCLMQDDFMPQKPEAGQQRSKMRTGHLLYTACTHKGHTQTVYSNPRHRYLCIDPLRQAPASNNKHKARRTCRSRRDATPGSS